LHGCPWALLRLALRKKEMARHSLSSPKTILGTFSGAFGKESRRKEFSIYSKCGSAKDTKNPPNPPPPKKTAHLSTIRKKTEVHTPLSRSTARRRPGASGQWHWEKHTGAQRARGASVFPVR